MTPRSIPAVLRRKTSEEIRCARVPNKIRGDATGQVDVGGWDDVREAYADYLIEVLADSYLPALQRQLPTPDFAGYRSPVDNVYLCGSGSHPGAGVSMAPGRNAAQVICGDLGLDFDALVPRT
jgi:hypothetical protein